MNTVRLLVRCYFGLSVLTVLAIIAMRNNESAVTPAVWVRGTIVAVTALLMTTFIARSARGSQRAFLRLRIVSAIVLVAIVVIVVLPRAFPVWFRIEQAVCGLLVLGIVLLVNGRRLRSTIQDGPAQSKPSEQSEQSKQSEQPTQSEQPKPSEQSERSKPSEQSKQ